VVLSLKRGSWGTRKSGLDTDDELEIGKIIWGFEQRRDLGYCMYKINANTIQFKVRLHGESFQSYKCDPPSNEVEISKEELVDMYTKMVGL